MAHLIIKRDGSWRDRLRRYDVVVDGERAARLRADAAAHISLPEGPHRLHMAIDGWGSEVQRVFVSEGCPTIVRCAAGPVTSREIMHGVACKTDYIVTEIENIAEVAREYLSAAWRIAAYRISQHLPPGPLGSFGLATGELGVLYRGCRDAKSTVLTTAGTVNHDLWLHLVDMRWLEPAEVSPRFAPPTCAFRVTDLGRIELLDILQ